MSVRTTPAHRRVVRGAEVPELLKARPLLRVSNDKSLGSILLSLISFI
jgi:hypothetical protein